MRQSLCAVIALAGLAGAASAQVQLQEIARIDLRSFFDSTNPQGLGSNINAVAWNGTDLYVAGFKNTSSGANTGILRIDTPLATGTASTAAFGAIATGTSRGYSGLDINGNTLLATHDTGTANATGIQAFNLTPGNSLRWNAGTFLGNNRGFAGPSFNPGFNGGTPGQGASFVIQGPGQERVLNETTGAGAGTSGFLNGVVAANAASGGQTAFRDIDHDPATGDIYTRTNNQVTRGVRTGSGSYQLDGTGNLPILVALGTSNQTATNIQFLETTAFGDLLIFNNRASTAAGQNFFTVTLVTNTLGVSQTVSFLNPSGGAFAPFGTGNAGYDYSFHAPSQTLAISDFLNNQVYLFQVPTPGAAALLGLGGLVALRRRR